MRPDDPTLISSNDIPHPADAAHPPPLGVPAIQDTLQDTLARQSAEQLAALYEGWAKPEGVARNRGPVGATERGRR
jgi:hypothetical protein